MIHLSPQIVAVKFGLLLLFVTASLNIAAYEPGVEELEQQVAKLEFRITEMAADTGASADSIIAIKNSILDLKDQIVEAKEHTISSLRRQQTERNDNRETLGLIAFALLLVAILAVSFLALFGKRLELQKGEGVFQLLANDLQSQIAVDHEKDKRRFRVHFIVLLGVSAMFVSMCMYLFRVM